MSEKRRIVSNTLANGLAQFVSMAAALVFMPLLIGSFGSTDFGLYLLASAVASYASIVDFGVGTSLVKNVAEKSATRDEVGLGKYISTSLVFYICAGAVIAVALAGIGFSTASLFKVTADGARLLRNMLLVVAVTSVWTWPAGTGALILGGLQKYTLTARTAIFAAMANVVVVLAVLALGEGPLTLIVGQSVVSAIASATNLVFARRAIPNVRVRPGDADMLVFREIVSFSWVIFVLQLCTVIIYQQTDRVVLGVFLGAAAVTLYESAGKMQSLVTQVTSFATSAVMPFATQLDVEGRQASLQTLFFRGTKYVMALVLPVVVGLMVLAKPIIAAWLGPEFAHQALAAQVLLSYQLLSAGAVVGESILISRGHAKRRLFNSVFVVTLGNLVLSIILVQRFGILGVVIGTAVPWIVDFPWRLRVALTEVGVTFGEWLRQSAGPAYTSLVATIVIALGCQMTPLADSLPGLMLAMMLSVTVAWLVLIVFMLTPVEKQELQSIVQRLIGRAG